MIIFRINHLLDINNDCVQDACFLEGLLMTPDE